MNVMKKSAIVKEAKGYMFMLLGCVAYALSTSLFLAPNEIIAGGVTGLAVLINYLNPKILIGMISIALNVPMLIIGIKYQGLKFVIRCLITVATLGIVTDLLSFFPPLTSDGVLASIYGGICQGIGIGLFVKYEFSSGGTELLGRLINRIIKWLSIPILVGILDGIIVIVGSIVTKNPQNMLHALIVVFLSAKVSEIVLVGLETSKLCIVVTDKGEEMGKTLVEKSPRGVTLMDGKGMYTGKHHDVILTCVKNRQLPQFKLIVHDIDKNAFVIVTESKEVRGKGFREWEDNERHDNN